MNVSFIISTPLTHQGAVLIQASEFRKYKTKEELNNFNFAINCFYNKYNQNIHLPLEECEEIEKRYKNGTFIISVYYDINQDKYLPIMYHSNDGEIKELPVFFNNGLKYYF